MIRAVIDTNVLVSALISPFGNEARVLDALQRNLITPYFSRSILDEYAGVLSRPKFGFSSEKIQGLIGLIEAKGRIFEPVPMPGASPDSGDDDFIACAFAAQAEYIVTGNKRHFPAESCGQTKVISARELIEALSGTHS